MKHEFLKENFRTQNFWIAHANNTAAIVLGFTGVFVFWVSSQIVVKPVSGYLQAVLTSGFILTGALTITFLILALIPRLGDRKGSSMIFFGDIASQEWEEFKKRLDEINEKTLGEMWAQQIHANAKIATKKFMRVRWAMLSLIVNMVLGLFLILLYL